MLSFGRSSQYEAAKTQLERETAALLAERKQLQQHQGNRFEKKQSPTQIEALIANINPAANKMEQSAKRQELVSRLQEIIQLCKEEGSLTSEQMLEILKVQNQVQSYRQQENLEEVPKFVDPDQAPASSRQLKFKTIQSQVSQNQKFEQNQKQQVIQRYEQIQKRSKISLSQDTLEIIAQIQRKALGEIIRLQSERDQMKAERDKLLLDLKNSPSKSNSNVRGQIQRLKEENKLVIQQNYELKTQLKEKTTEIQHMESRLDVTSKISSAQQKALHEKLKEVNKLIVQQNETLKNQLNILITEKQGHKNYQVNPSSTNVNAPQSVINEKLKEENRLIIQENYELKSQLKAIALDKQRDQSYQVNSSTHQHPYQAKQNLLQAQFDSQIAVYQNQLIRAATLIQELNKRLQNVPGLEELRAQGELIRRDTTELLKRNKGGVSTESRLVRELQQRLDEEEKGKAMFLEELRAFKQRFTELEEENEVLKRGGGRISFEPNPKPPGSNSLYDSRARQGIMKKKTSAIEDYEKTLHELRHAINF